jgi:hypothetical protein
MPFLKVQKVISKRKVTDGCAYNSVGLQTSPNDSNKTFYPIICECWGIHVPKPAVYLFKYETPYLWYGKSSVFLLHDDVHSSRKVNWWIHA